MAWASRLVHVYLTRLDLHDRQVPDSNASKKQGKVVSPPMGHVQVLLEAEACGRDAHVGSLPAVAAGWHGTASIAYIAHTHSNLEHRASQSVASSTPADTTIV